MSRLASQFEIKPLQGDPDTVLVREFPEDEDDICNMYSVVQFGLWWWKSFVVARFIPEMGAPSGSWSSGSWEPVSKEFKTREEARVAAYRGEFKYV